MIQRRRIRKAFHKVDPINTILTMAYKNQEKSIFCFWTYVTVAFRCVTARSKEMLFNFCYRSESKLIRWGLVIHGCIDGFSRLVVI